MSKLEHWRNDMENEFRIIRVSPSSISQSKFYKTFVFNDGDIEICYDGNILQLVTANSDGKLIINFNNFDNVTDSYVSLVFKNLEKKYKLKVSLYDMVTECNKIGESSFREVLYSLLNANEESVVKDTNTINSNAEKLISKLELDNINRLIDESLVTGNLEMFNKLTSMKFS